jgi:hypothetical protein
LEGLERIRGEGRKREEEGGRGGGVEEEEGGRGRKGRRGKGGEGGRGRKREEGEERGAYPFQIFADQILGGLSYSHLVKQIGMVVTGLDVHFGWSIGK